MEGSQVLLPRHQEGGVITANRCRDWGRTHNRLVMHYWKCCTLKNWMLFKSVPTRSFRYYEDQCQTLVWDSCCNCGAWRMWSLLLESKLTIRNCAPWWHFVLLIFCSWSPFWLYPPCCISTGYLKTKRGRWIVQITTVLCSKCWSVTE